MKRQGVIIGLFLLCGSLAAQRVWDAFCFTPDTILPFLSIQQRAALIKMAAEQRYDSLENQFGGYSRLLEWREDEKYLALQLTPTVKYEWWLKTANNTESADTLFFVQTVCVPVCVSVVQAYTPTWQYLTTLQPPFKADMVSATAQSGTIVFTDETPNLLDEEERRGYHEE